MTETEIKLPVATPSSIRKRLRELGWRAAGRRRRETNLVYDRPDHSLEAAGMLLRLRRMGRSCRLTLKLPNPGQGIHKVRDEHEIDTRDAASAERILEGLGFHVAWRYEKIRTTYRKPAARGEIVLDQTPIGDFLELEGDPAWIDETSAKLGYAQSDYITATYRDLFVQHQRQQNLAARDMLFPAAR